VKPAQQLTLNFEPGLAERHRTLKACVRERVYAHPKPLKSIAADMDMSETELSRKLADNPNDTRNFNCDDLERYIRETGDSTPIFYLVEKYAVNPEAQRAFAAAQLAKSLPEILALAKSLGVGAKG
jgi:AraC-like DNA-binding protein